MEQQSNTNQYKVIESKTSFQKQTNEKYFLSGVKDINPNGFIDETKTYHIKGFQYK